MFKYVKRYWPAAAVAAVALALPAVIWAVETAGEVAETACCCCPLCCL